MRAVFVQYYIIGWLFNPQTPKVFRQPKTPKDHEAQVTGPQTILEKKIILKT